MVKGDIPYEFVATNLYDLEADPEGIRTAHPGDGKIFVMPVEESYVVRTGERVDA